MATADQWTGYPVMNGKGDKQRLSQVSTEQFDENWDRAFGKQPTSQPTDLWAFPPKGNMLREVNYDGMWQHSCTVEMAVMWVGKGQECNWCGETEEDGQ